jgi:hypothetical protein
MRRLSIHCLFGIAACALTATAMSSAASAAAITSASDPALAGATIQDFETSTLGNYVSHSFGGFTITAQNTAHDTPASFDIATDFAGSYNTRGLQHVSNFGNEFQSLRFDFAAATSAFGFLFGASDSTWTLDAYNSSNILLDTYTIPATGASNAGDFFGLSGLNGASYATLIQNEDGFYTNCIPAGFGCVDYVFVDNFTYKSGTITTVPEPFTLSLFGTGLAGAVAMRRRKKKVA